VTYTFKYGIIYIHLQFCITNYKLIPVQEFNGETNYKNLYVQCTSITLLQSWHKSVQCTQRLMATKYNFSSAS